MKSLLLKKIASGLLSKICFLALNCVATSTNATLYQNHESIYEAAEIYVNNKLLHDANNDRKIKIGKLDSRLNLKQCGQRLHAYMPKGSRGSGKTTIGIKCNGKNSWSLHVPVTISHYKKVLVATKQLQKGSVLQTFDFKLVKHDVSKLPYGFLESLNDGLGMKLKKRIKAGSVLTPGMLVKPKIISRGQQITIMAKSGRMTVRVDGKALANGAVGERIKVINLKTKQKLEGVITDAGEVKVEI